MGVSGMRGVLEKVPLCEPYMLKDTMLVVDLTDPPYWFFKRRPYELKEMDKFGTDLIGLCNFLITFITSLLQSNIKPIFVYSGVRLNRSNHSDLATKALHLEYSSRVSMYVLTRGRARDSFTPLVTNAVKQVIKLFPDLPNPIQAQYETHPILQKLAEEFNCPVLTSHSEFILKSVRTGFILYDDFPFTPATHSRGIPIQKFYRHSLLLQHYRLQHCSDAMHTLFALLRPDVSGRYCTYVNNLLHLQNTDLSIPKNDTVFVEGRRPARPGNLTRRMRHIFETWPKHLTTSERVRRELISISGGDRTFLNDYDDILSTFVERFDFTHSIVSDDQFVRAPALQNPQIGKINNALISRCATANFSVHLLMGQKLYENNQVNEDYSVPRSSFSIADPARSFIMGRFGVGSLEVLDRQYAQVITRTLYASPYAPNEPVESRHLYNIFLFPHYIQSNENLTERIKDFQVKLALKDDYAEQLVVLLRLASFAFRLVFGDNLERDKQLGETKKNTDTPHGNRTMDIDYGRNGLELLATATYNCFMYYMMQNMDERLNKENLNNDPRLCDDSKGINYLPGLRVARTDIGKLPACNEYIANYITVKHAIEMLNRAIQGYCEVNSLFEYKTYPLKVSEYYNGALIFKIMSKLMQTKAEGLLRLEGPLKDFILD